jgi:hypothetical protein
MIISPVVIEGDVGGMVELRVDRDAVLGVAELAGAGHGLEGAVLDAPHAMVVPVDDVHVAVGADGDVLRQVEVRLGRRQAVVVDAGEAGAGDGDDGRRRAAVERRLHGGEQLVDRDGAVALRVEAGTLRHRLAAERDVDALQELVDRDLAVAVAVTGARRGGCRSSEKKDGAMPSSQPATGGQWKRSCVTPPRASLITATLPTAQRCGIDRDARDRRWAFGPTASKA